MSQEKRKVVALGHLALSESGFLFDPSTGFTYTLNPTGTHVVRALIHGTGVDELGGVMAEAFEVQAEDAARDVAEFLMQLKELGLVPEELIRG